jgi:hypothetical protein
MANKTTTATTTTTTAAPGVDGVIAALVADRDARLAAGESVDVSAVQQQITAVRQLEVLRGELAAAVANRDWLRAADVEGHIAFWLRLVPVDAAVLAGLADPAGVPAER